MILATAQPKGHSMTRSPNAATDHLIHAARNLANTCEWLLDTASDHGHLDDCCSESGGVVSDHRRALERTARRFTEYSDGRPIETHVELDGGRLSSSWLWPADLADLRTEPFDVGPYGLAADNTPGDRGSVIVTFHADFTYTTTYLPPLEVVR